MHKVKIPCHPSNLLRLALLSSYDTNYINRFYLMRCDPFSILPLKDYISHSDYNGYQDKMGDIATENSLEIKFCFSALKIPYIRRIMELLKGNHCARFQVATFYIVIEAV